MKCQFCDNPHDLGYYHQYFDRHCKSCYVVYLMENGCQDEAVHGYMKVAYHHDRGYAVKWMTTENRFEISIVPSYKIIIKLDFCPKEITPLNIQDKLPGLLLFS